MAKKQDLSPIQTAALWLDWLEQGGWAFALDDNGQVVATPPADGGPRPDPTNGLAALDVEVRQVLEARAKGEEITVGESPAPEPAPVTRQYRTISRLLKGPVTEIIHKPGGAGGWWTVRVGERVEQLGSGRRLASESPRLLRELWAAAEAQRR